MNIASTRLLVIQHKVTEISIHPSLAVLLRKNHKYSDPSTPEKLKSAECISIIYPADFYTNFTSN